MAKSMAILEPRRSRALALLALLLLASACGKTPELTRETARALVEASPSFSAPLDADIVGSDTRLKDNPSMKREIVRIEGIAIKPDGPFGMAGATASAAFTWRWNAGPFAGQVYKAVAKLHSGGDAWKVYDDQLERQLRLSMKGEE